MDESERNRRLMLLIQKLYQDKDLESLELLESLVKNDSKSLQFSFKIMTNSTPLATLLGIEKLGDLNIE